MKTAIVQSSDLSSHDLRPSTYVDETAPTKTRRSSAGKKSGMSSDNDSGTGSVGRQGFTFSADEVHALSQLFGVLYRGGDVRVMIRSKTVAKLASKFNERSSKLKSAARPSDKLVDILG